MRVLIAPDKFRGTLDAATAADAMARGWRRGDPSADVETIPMADGGEGTLDALVAALGGRRVPATVQGPLGDPVDAEYGLAPSEQGQLAIVEMARASGLALLAPSRRDPRRTSTWGTGQLIRMACQEGARRVVVCIGGSATVDGGAGLAQAVGIRLLDGSGRDLRPGGASLQELARIDASGLDPTVRATRFVVATDVDNPLIGPTGAAVVYGPQKGASPDDVLLLDRALGHFAAVVHRDLGIDVRHVAGAGAAGGMGAGLVAFLGARLRPGVEVVMEAVRLRERLEDADLVVTGEGAFDGQSLHGKAPAGVLRAAAEAGVPAIVIAGRVDVPPPPPARAFALAERFGLQASFARTARLLEDLAAEVAADVRLESAEPGGR